MLHNKAYFKIDLPEAVVQKGTKAGFKKAICFIGNRDRIGFF